APESPGAALWSQACENDSAKPTASKPTNSLFDILHLLSWEEPGPTPPERIARRSGNSRGRAGRAILARPYGRSARTNVAFIRNVHERTDARPRARQTARASSGRDEGRAREGERARASLASALRVDVEAQGAVVAHVVDGDRRCVGAV